MATHTQGDWYLASINDGDDDDEIVTIVNGCTVNIGSVFSPGRYSEACPDGEPEPTYEVSAEEAAANGRLLVEAARMFAALELIERGHAGGSSFSGTDCAEIAALALARVRAG